ncbi:chemotaxis protein CheW [Derxia lacustris]|uniref:chemotaxis protein CheW n=1 Tax=Derxia lacustris TaxID=764842 RepID=UPI000A172A64|nr:chemotaxis protein CheW [Derxia lacustris]
MQASPQARVVAAAVAPAEAPPTAQYLRFALGREHFALPIESVREILELAELTPVPLMPAFLRGVMNLRGVVVPVIDLASRFDLGNTVATRRSCVVVVELPGSETGTRVLGMLVDSVSEVVDLAADRIEPTPALGTCIAPGFIRGMARLPGRLVMVLDLARVLDAEDLDRLVSQHAAH